MDIINQPQTELSQPYTPPRGPAPTPTPRPSSAREAEQQAPFPSVEVLRDSPDMSLRDSADVALETVPYEPRIRFEDVCFSYPSRPDQQVLKGVTLDIPPGSRLAVLGESGSGKSTLAQILLRLYPPTSGKVFLGPHSLMDCDPRWVRAQFGVVNQDPILFALSIRDNVLYGKLAEMDYMRDQSDLESMRIERPRSKRKPQYDSHEHLTPQLRTEFDKVLRAAHVADFVEQMPDKLDTFVGERGQALSGGQKQRVCIARALIRDPPMLLFDEATSALDNKSEKLVHTALEEAMKGRTCLLITHRLSTLDFAEYIAVLSDGEVAQFGAKADVLRRPCPELSRILNQMSHTTPAETADTKTETPPPPAAG